MLEDKISARRTGYERNEQQILGSDKMAADHFSALVCDLSGPPGSASVPAGRLFRSLRPISVRRLVPALTLRILPSEECSFLFSDCFLFFLCCLLLR